MAAGAARRARRFALAAGAALFLVLASAVVDTARVETERELAQARFGLPFEFVEARSSLTPPLPARISWNPWEDPAVLLPVAFLASVGAVVVPLLALAVAWEVFSRRRP